MRWIKKITIMLLLLVVSGGSLKVQAAYNKCLDDKYKTQTVRVDLNKDGKKETIKAVYRESNWNRQLYINNKLVLKYVDKVWIADIDTKDQYIEIVVFDGINKLKIYRYNGKKIVLYASAKTDATFTGMLKKNRIRAVFESNMKANGNGTITICSPIGMNSATDYWNTRGICECYLNYTVKKNSIKYNQSAIVKANLANDVDCLKVKKKWEAYKYPRVKSNKKVFTIKKGERIRITNFKFTSTYTYMKIKKEKTKQVGWIIFRTKDLDK